MQENYIAKLDDRTGPKTLRCLLDRASKLCNQELTMVVVTGSSMVESSVFAIWVAAVVMDPSRSVSSAEYSGCIASAMLQFPAQLS